MKKPTGSVWFRFFKPGTRKTEPKKTESNRFEPVFAIQNRTEPVGLNRFRFFFKKFGLVTFFDKNRTEPKMNTRTKNNRK